MSPITGLYKFAGLFFVFWLIQGCAGQPLQLPAAKASLYVPASMADTDADLLYRFAPLIKPADTGFSYNRIGSVMATVDQAGKEQISINPGQASYYVEQREFSTSQGQYTNLVYRVHFDRVPFSLWPFYLTAGRHGGLLIIVTLNSLQQPVLISTVHTCGCYLAIVPTNLLPPSAWPPGWDAQQQRVFGVNLPGLVHYSEHESGRLVISLQHGTHRVIDVAGMAEADIGQRYHIIEADMLALQALYQLPLNGSTTSFYYKAGPGLGYVKGSSKPWERLFMSWWAWDWRVGVDKDYATSQAPGPVFNTSLKPWRRHASDMRDFASFLSYWGWRL